MNKICSRRTKEKTCNQQIKQLVVLSAALTEVLSQSTAGRCDKIISTFLSSLRKIKEERFENQLSSPFVPKIFFHHFLFLKESFIIDYHCFLANTQIINFNCWVQTEVLCCAAIGSVQPQNSDFLRKFGMKNMIHYEEVHKQ